MIETQTDRKIKTLISDNGGEYKYDPFLEAKHFGLRITYASHLINWLPTAANKGKTPMEGKQVGSKGKEGSKFVVSRDVTFDEAVVVSQNKHEGETKATKTRSSLKQVELLKTLVVLVRSDVTDTSPIVDSDDEDEDDEEEAST
ncbi:unnamed protein product [Prunus armeniaca]